MSFRLQTIFYVVAIFASSLATFGLWGVVLAASVVVFWYVILRGSANAKRALAMFVVAAIVCLVIVSLFLPAISIATPFARMYSCLNNLKQISTALLLYRDANGSFPPSARVDGNGNGTLSWRVLILPHIEEVQLYRTFDLSKSWNSPGNRAATSTSIVEYLCPDEPSNAPTTNYFAITGPKTAWRQGRGVTKQEIGDGPENTIVVIEAHRPKVNWAEPSDLTFEDAVELLAKPASVGDGHPIDHGFFFKPATYRNVAFADGSAMNIKVPLSRDMAEALLTANGREHIDHEDFEKLCEPQLDYGRCYCLGVFICLTLLPIASLKRRSDNSAGDA
jgi:hypothetical protein